MPRNFAQIRPEMWLDDEWRAMTPAGQHLYMLMLTDPELSHCGVADWRPGRIAQRAAEWSTLQVMQAAVECSDHYFLVFDQDTEEVLVRSFLKHDGLLKQPRMHVSVAKAFGGIGSNKIRAAIVFELLRLQKVNPLLEGWEKPQMKTVLRQRAVNAKEMDTDLALGSEVALGVTQGLGLGVGQGEDEGRVSGLLPPAPAPAPAPAPFSKENSATGRSSYPQPEGLRAVGQDKTIRKEAAS